jgi:hypothetical protein
MSLTRNEKIKKLSNSVREFRGAYDPKTGKMVSPGQTGRLAACLKMGGLVRSG